jgi:hypothetical protein
MLRLPLKQQNRGGDLILRFALCLKDLMVIGANVFNDEMRLPNLGLMKRRTTMKKDLVDLRAIAVRPC